MATAVVPARAAVLTRDLPSVTPRANSTSSSAGRL